MNDKLGRVTNRHWTADEVVDFVYGVGPDAAHLKGCAECAARVSAAERRRTVAAGDADVDALFLAAQRRAVMGRLNQGPRQRTPWLQVAAATAAAVAVFWMYPQQQREQTVLTAISDGSYAEAYYDEIAEPAPQAVAPIDELFDEGGMD